MLVTVYEIAIEKGVSVGTVNSFKKDNSIFYEEKRGYFKLYNRELFSKLQSVSFRMKIKKKRLLKIPSKRFVVGLLFHRKGTDWHVCEISDGYVFYRQFRHGKKMQKTRVYMISVRVLASEILEEGNKDCFIIEN